jgi:manganese oxidase
MRDYAILVIVLIFGVFIIGCTQPSLPSGNPASTPAIAPAATQSGTAPSGPAASVTIRDKAFNPAILTISSGTTVTWTNDDKVSHRVVHLPGPQADELFHSDRLDPGQSFSYTFTKPGRYEYADPQYAGGRTSSVIVT